MKYALIAPDGQRIIQTGDAPEDMIAFQGGDLLSLPAPEDVEDDTHYWDGEAFRLYPPRPGPWAVWDGAAWIDPRSEADHAAELAAARAAAEIDKSDLLLTLMDLRILSPEEVDEASSGTIPATFETMMADWPIEARIAARVKWRADARISRTNPVIMAAGYALGVPDEVMDWIFVV